MAITINSVDLGPIWFQSGNGIPDHMAFKGTLFIDLDTAIEYINKDGFFLWEVNGGGGPVGPDIYISGMSFNNGNYDLILNRNDGVNFTQNLGILASDMTVTGGTYNVNTGIVTFTNNSGGTFNVTGFTSGMTDSYTTGATLVGNSIEFDNNIYGSDFYSVDLTPVISGKTDNSLFNLHTGNTSNPHQTSFNNLISTAHTHSISDIDNLQTILNSKFDNTGGTISGNITVNTISATTYQNLPTNLFVGGTGTTNTVPKFTSLNNIGNSSIIDNGSFIRINGQITGTTSMYDFYDSSSTLRTRLTGSGAQTWFLNNGLANVGSVAYSTPNSNPGIVFLGLTGNGRTDIRLNSQTGGLAFATGTGSGTTSTQVLLTTNGNFLINTTTDNNTDKLQINGSLVATTIKKSGGLSTQFLKADGSVDTNPSQIRLSASTAISTLTNDVSGFGQNGRNVIIDNSTAITLTTSVSSESNFIASYLKHGITPVTFSAGSGTVVSALTGTLLMNGGAGSRATLNRVDNLFYLTITNV